MPNTSSNYPRVAVTGYYANIGFRAIGFSGLGDQTLKNAFQQFIRDKQLPTGPNPSLNPGPVLDAELAAAGLRRNSWLVDAERVGIVMGKSKFHSLLEHRPNPFEAIYQMKWHLANSDEVAVMAARALGTRGPVLTPVAACATGAHCLIIGAQMLNWGHADVSLAGASEGRIMPSVMAGYQQLGALSKSGIMRPFDRRRDGFLPNSGSATLILESEEHAKARGAKIYGYIIGYDMGADATSMTGMCPSGDSIARAIERALKRAGNPQIDYINAHGTATHLNDEIESRGIKSVFGKSVPVSSTKPLTGHLLGAAGAVEAVICLQSLREQWAPPTLNLEEPDEACDLDYIPLTPDSCGRDLPLKTVMSLNYGFGGHIGVLIFEAAEE